MHHRDRLERLVSKHPGSKRGGRKRARSTRQRRLDRNRAARATLAARIETLNRSIIDEHERMT